VVTNGSARDAREVAFNFGRLSAVLRKTSSISTRSDVPLTILAVKSGRQLKTILGTERDDIAGIFAPGHDANVVIVRLDLDRDSRYEVAYHEYIHLLSHQTMGLLPLWLKASHAPPAALLDWVQAAAQGERAFHCSPASSQWQDYALQASDVIAVQGWNDDSLPLRLA